MKYWILTGLAILTIVVSADNASSRLDKNKRMRLKLQKPDIADLKFISVNNWRYVMRNNGSYMYDSPDADGDGRQEGGIFPRTLSTRMIYAGGFAFGTLKDGIPVVSEVDFASEYQPGRIVNSNVRWDSLKTEDPNDPGLRVYILTDTNTSDANLWPGRRDINGVPVRLGDAQTWTVFNDLDTSKSHESIALSPNPGLGLEITFESFAFKVSKVANSVVFRLLIRNKTSSNYSQSHFGLWVDADLGNNIINDVGGVDTLRQLGFVYNFTSDDEPLAVGLDLLQGPVSSQNQVVMRDYVKFGSNGTVLRHDPITRTMKHDLLPVGQFTLGLLSSTAYCCGGGDEVNNIERYNRLRGLDISGDPIKRGDPFGPADRYVFPGDPLGPNADTDTAVAKSRNQADIRLQTSAGPFTIPADSSQDIWFAVIGAEGTDRLDAVRNLFETDDFIQDFFNSGLSGLKPPDGPKLSVSPGDGKIILTWQNNAEYSEDTFGEALNIITSNGYTANYVKQDFQGYRVYRSRTGLVGSFELLAQYDLDDTLGVITNRTIGPNGNLQIDDVELGQNTGLRYFYVDSNVTNGQLYYYSVTAYDAQPYIAGPGSMSLGEDNTVIRAEATAVLLEDISVPAFDDSIYVLDSVAFTQGQLPFKVGVYRMDSDPNTLIGDTLYITRQRYNFQTHMYETLTHPYLCVSKQVHSSSYDHNEIRQKVPSPVVGQFFIDNRTLSAGTYSAQRDYTWTIKEIITTGLSIPRPAGIPVSLESSVLANAQSAVPQPMPFDRGQKASVDSAVHAQGVGDGSVTVSVVDPSQVREDNYTVRFVIVPTDSNGAPLVGASFLPSDRVVYEILNSSGIRPIQSRSDDPRTFYDANGNGVFDGTDIPLDESQFGTIMNVFNADPPFTVIVDGLSIAIIKPKPDVKRFQVIATGGGTLANPDMAAFAFNGSGFPTIDGQPPGGLYTISTSLDGLNDQPNVPNLITVVAPASAANGGKWGFHTGEVGGGQSFDFFKIRTFRNDNFDRFVPFDYEMRFTSAGGMGHMAFTTNNQVPVPFELWNIGVGIPDDPSDDYRMYARVLDDIVNLPYDDMYDLGGFDHTISSGDNDPYLDWVYWMNPADRSPGQAGYDACVAADGGALQTPRAEVMARTVLVNLNGGSVSDGSFPANVNQQRPADGTIFRIISTKPLSPSDIFTFSTNTVSQTISDNAIRSALKSIRVVPNPFYLTAYQQGLSFNKEIKFIHLPGNCTIRIFTVSGDLVRILQHNSTSNNNRPGFGPYSDESAAPLETSLESWDLRNDRGRLVASGIYIAAIEARGIGRQLVKFAVIQ